MIVTNNPYNARIIDLPLAVGKLRLKYSSRSTVETIPEALKRKHDNGQFLRIFHDSESTEHTLIRGSDGGIIAYHVPSAYLRQHGVNTDLYDTIERIRIKSLRQHKGAYRGEAVSRHYLPWCCYRKQPSISTEYMADGKPAQKFMEESQGLWEKASEIFQGVLPGKWRRLTEYPYPKGMQRMAGVWSGCALNIGSQSPVQTVVHRDVGESPFEYSCLTAFGDFQGADVELWEAEVSIELRPADLLLFLDACIHHSNTVVTGLRHSCVAFTPKNMYDWFVREYSASKELEISLRERRKIFQKNRKKTTESKKEKLEHVQQNGAGRTKKKRRPRGRTGKRRLDGEKGESKTL